MAGGSSNEIGDIVVVRYNADGTLDTGFGTNGAVKVASTAADLGSGVTHRLDLSRDGKSVYVSGEGQRKSALKSVGFVAKITL